MPLCRRGELSDLWRHVGLGDVEEDALAFPMEFDSFDDYWRPFLAGQGPAGAYASTMTESDREHAARATVRPVDGRPGHQLHDVGPRVGGARHRHLTVLPNCRTSCGSLPMLGKTVCRTSLPSSDRPARSSTRADRVLST